MFCRFWGWAAGCGNSEFRCDLRGDISEWNSYLINTVVLSTSFSFFEGEPKESGRIETMYGRPTVGAITYINGNSFLTGGFDDSRNKSVITRTMYGRRKANDRGTDSAWNET